MPALWYPLLVLFEFFNHQDVNAIRPPITELNPRVFRGLKRPVVENDRMRQVTGKSELLFTPEMWGQSSLAYSTFKSISLFDELNHGIKEDQPESQQPPNP